MNTADDFKTLLWNQFRKVQQKLVRAAETNERLTEIGESPLDYANRKINAMTNVQLIDALTE